MSGDGINYQPCVYNAKCLISHHVIDNICLGENSVILSFK